jgi:hypothetical protein
MRYTRVKVKRDTNTVHNKTVPEWEIPLLEFIFEDGNVEVLEEYENVQAREYPTPAAEYQRLTQVYGSDPQSGVPYVASVYGQAQAGVRALAKAMESARAEELADANELPAPKPVARRKRASAEADALLS